MAYWGMALANVNNPKRARGFLAEANARAEKVELTPRERAYLAATGSLFKEEGKSAGGDAQWFRGLAQGLEEVIKVAPDDLDARAWLALALYQSDHMDSVRAVDIVLESVLKADPNHPGAHHYRIHLWDGRDATQSLASAAAYSGTAPGIAHAWHMPGHTYTALHRYADAARHQEAAARVDHAAMTRDRVLPFEIHNYFHNNQWLCTSLGHVGRVREAVEVARNLTRQPHDSEKNNASNPGSAQRLGRLRWAEVLSRYELWDELLAATNSGELDWSDQPTEQLLKAYSLGLAYAAKGDDLNLAAEIKALREMVAERDRKAASKPKKVTFEVEPDQLKQIDPAEVARQVVAGLKTVADQVTGPDPVGAKSSSAEAAAAHPGQWGELTIEAALAELEGYQLLAGGDIATAFVRFSKTTAMRTEARSRAHLRVENYAFAQTSAATGVERAPDEIPPLAAQVEILATLGREDEAKQAYQKLKELTRDADRDLPVFRRIASLAASWAEPGGNLGTTDNTQQERRAEMSKLGPLTYQPFSADPFALSDTAGNSISLEQHRGRNLLVLFYLGGKCAHCLQQLKEFGEAAKSLGESGTDIVAIGTDDAAVTKELKENDQRIKFPMPLLADPTLSTFKAYGVFDEFEGRALHGAFLVDSLGRVHWRRISADPFMDVDFIKREAARITRINNDRRRGDGK